MAATSNIQPVLSEDDIPGASLCGRSPAKLKIDELRFWLKCRGDPSKGLKTKAQYIKRVEEYITTGRDQIIVDPDPNEIYTRRKQRQDTSRDRLDQSSSSTSTAVQYPQNGWTTSLQRMPFFSRAEMNVHIAKSGKNIDPQSQGHSVPTGLRKAKTFLNDEYLKEIHSSSDDSFFYFKALCYHSFKKHEPPHKLQVALRLVTGEVQQSSCSCVAGRVGFCNHVLALMLKLCKFSLYECKDTKELDQEDDMQPAVVCTSSLQQWHKTGRGDKIKPKPVMELVVKKTKLDDSVKSAGEGLRCLLYEARKHPKTQAADEIQLKANLQKINPNMPLAQILTQSTTETEFKETKFGKSPCGSFGSYQLQFTESNVKVFCDIDSIARINPNMTGVPKEYPKFPLQNTEQYKIPEHLGVQQKALLEHLSVDAVKLNTIEENTREQSNSDEWKNERKYRLTASNFKTICCRQRNHNTFVNSLLHPKPFTSKYTVHGNAYEPIALRQYQKYMFSTRKAIELFKSGLVVSIDTPFLAASPDGKVKDAGCEDSFGLIEVKCPETKFLVTPLDACSDPAFFCEEVDGKPKLKQAHQYYYQVQGQLGVTGANWCDFVVYTSMGMSIERIEANVHFWREKRDTLQSYFFDKFLNTAAAEFHKDNRPL